MNKHPMGFTLIEVLIALVILSIGLTALLQSTGRAIQTTTLIEHRIARHFIAMNVLAELQLGQIQLHLHESKTGQMIFFGKKWTWQAHLEKTALKSIESIIIKTSLQPTGPFTHPLYATRNIANDVSMH